MKKLSSASERFLPLAGAAMIGCALETRAKGFRLSLA